ncbi:hypothetical protein MBAV_004783 [Candidatus Magnetobacterium bavaricum]|uniref:Uncharacterized protein n=1 Tax=Candidatus Magnetobacterium bavaricum TaxID=29290 RepID=A0A0F3GMA5_9BACT|nr:hypothetical protein MBAV_004783 [Candidatus Magnetobacterium bavaricum]
MILIVTFSVSTFASDESNPGEQSPAEFTGIVGVTALNKYLFRGNEIGSKSLILQPYVSLSAVGFTVVQWGSFDFDQHRTQSFYPKEQGTSSFNETDMFISYKNNIDKLVLSCGYDFYGLHYARDSQDVFVSVGYADANFLNPTLKVYREIAAWPNFYFNLSLTRSFPVYKGITLDLGASFGHLTGVTDHWKTFDEKTNAYTDGRYSAFHDGMVQAGFTVPVTKSLILQPMTQFWYPLSADAGKAPNGTSYNPHGKIDNTFVYGLNMMYLF